MPIPFGAREIGHRGDLHREKRTYLLALARDVFRAERSRRLLQELQQREPIGAYLKLVEPAVTRRRRYRPFDRGADLVLDLLTRPLCKFSDGPRRGNHVVVENDTRLCDQVIAVDPGANLIA